MTTKCLEVSKVRFDRMTAFERGWSIGFTRESILDVQALMKCIRPEASVKNRAGKHGA